MPIYITSKGALKSVDNVVTSPVIKFTFLTAKLFLSATNKNVSFIKEIPIGKENLAFLPIASLYPEPAVPSPATVVTCPPEIFRIQ